LKGRILPAVVFLRVTRYNESRKCSASVQINTATVARGFRREKSKSIEPLSKEPEEREAQTEGGQGVYRAFELRPTRRSKAERDLAVDADPRGYVTGDRRGSGLRRKGGRRGREESYSSVINYCRRALLGEKVSQSVRQ
jgi:hypothetical protein